MAVAPPVRMPKRRDSPSSRAATPMPKTIVATTAADDQGAVVPAEAADLLDGDPRAEQRHAEAAGCAARRSRRRACALPFGGDGVERHAEQQRVEQRRPAPMFGDERRGDRDDDGEQRAPASAAGSASRQPRQASLRPSLAGSARARVDSSRTNVLGLRPLAVPGRGIEMTDGADVDEPAAPCRRERGDALVARRADRWCSPRRCSGTAAATRGVGSHPFSRRASCDG